MTDPHVKLPSASRLQEKAATPGYTATNSEVEALLDLVDKINRLAPSHRNPHEFHEQKSEIAAELRRLAKAGVWR